jgi:tetratricopeptide (TPR) repeat protein
MKINHYTKKYKRIIKWLAISVSLALLLATPLTPSVSYSLGNTFFGGVKPLYHLPLAQFFYRQAAYPLLPFRTPDYAHYQLSRTYFIKGDLERAVSEAKKELALYPNNARTYYMLGLSYGYQNREKDAVDAFAKYLEVYPASWAARNDKAWLEFRVGNVNEAIKTLHPIVETHIANVWVQNTYCGLLIAKRIYDRAEVSCNLAKTAVEKMDEKAWGVAYPGNDPRIYGEGLAATKKSIETNLQIIKDNTTPRVKTSSSTGGI